MAKNNQPSDKPAPDIIMGDSIMNDPAMAGLKDDKQYTKFNANVTTDPGGVIQDIPEQASTPINVNLSSDDDEHNESGGFMRDPEDVSGTETEDIADDTKVDLALVTNELLFTGLDLLNDFIVKKLVVNEEKLKELAIQGEIPFEIIQIRAQFAVNYVFDMAVFLNDQEQKTRKALEFTNAEKKHISLLLEKALKSKKLKMSPEWAIVASLAGHYGAAIYQLFMNNMEVMKMVTLISEQYTGDKEAMKGNAAHVRAAAKKQSAQTVTPETVTSTDEEQPEGSPENPLNEMREPGEVPNAPATPAKPRNGKRNVKIPDMIEDVSVIK